MSESFVIVVPAPENQFDVAAAHVTRAPAGDDEVALEAGVTTIRMGVAGLLALKVQIETALMLGMGEAWVRKLCTMVAATDREVFVADTWDTADALDRARLCWDASPDDMPAEAVAIEVRPASELDGSA